MRATSTGWVMCMLGLGPALTGSMEIKMRCKARSAPNLTPTSTWAVKTCAEFRGEPPGEGNCGSSISARRWACPSCPVEEWRRQTNTPFCTQHPSTPPSFFVSPRPHPNARFGRLNRDHARED
ncbi:hypothetical protein PGTUg99_027928 [Puccinia graminis f. sp. tritici]|uniref:Secreted protein n=1 Tax=Puccinia graminis f. sp. tritici TaxID=56615 RepID=A0A5B0LSJ1_PUCGR|nr:hypothetical protein PGTUg99_027928 [Puccinia graminis f. sp. tritici]